MKLNVPFVDLTRTNRELSRVLVKEFKQGLSEANFILGSKLIEFEKKFAEFVGSNYVIGVGNGTDAIEIALRAYELPVGSRIIVPAMTFSASAIGVVRAGHVPVFVDVDEKYGLIDLDITEELLKKGAKGVIAVHLYGQAADLVKVNELAQIYGAIVIGDAAQAHGALTGGKKLGELSETSVYSFYPTKNLGALGDGGAIATNNLRIAKKCSSIRNYGSTIKYFHEDYGFNSRLDDLQARFLIAKLINLSNVNKEREKIANLYIENFSGVRDIVLPKVAKFNYHVWHLFPIRHKRRKLLADKLNERGIGTAIHYPVALPDQKIFSKAEYIFSKISVARVWAEEELSLPLQPYLRKEELIHVWEAVIKSCEEIK